MKRAMNIMKTLASKLKEVALQSYFFILGLTLFNLGIFLFNLKIGIITTGIIFIVLALIINSEKRGGK